MAHNAYCNECGTRVPLTEEGACAFGHPRSSLRDVREGEFSPGPLKPSAGRDGPLASSERALGTPKSSRPEEVMSAVLGKMVVIVPAIVVIMIALWTGYVVGVGMGQSKLEAGLWSVASLLMTGALVAMVVWNRRRKMNR